MIQKRIFDLVFTIPALLLLLPAFAVIGAWVKFDSPGPIFFRQSRVGQHGRLFRIYKFRTMVSDAEAKGRQITVGNDPRITRSGCFLRKYKLDEFPQLLNVIMGEMSLVGPRPEVPKYVAFYPEGTKKLVLSVPPGITDYASIEYKDENEVLALAEDPEAAYIEKVLPAKLKYYQRYIQERSLLYDLVIILRTLKAIVK